MIKIQRALISVSDKSGVLAFVQTLRDRGVEILSTGGTAKMLRDAGVAVTLCTDSWLMSGVSLTDEYLLAHHALKFTSSELAAMALTAFEHAFLSPPEKDALLSRARNDIASTS